MSLQNHEWKKYLSTIYQLEGITQMPIIGNKSSMATIATDEIHEDPFWGSFEHAIEMVQFFNILPKDECKYWTEFIADQEYPTEEELDTFVSICKEGIKSITKTNDCTFVGLVDSVDNIEGFWPYA